MRTAQAHPEAKERILDAAHRLILAQGYEGTSVDDICEAVGQTKGSFFHYFESKADLAETLLRRYIDQVKQNFMAAYPHDEPDPAKRLFSFLSHFRDRMAQSPHFGCLMGTMAQELAVHSAVIRDATTAAFENIAQLLSKDLDAAKALYAPKASWDPKSVADHFVVSMQGGQLVTKVKQDKRIGQETLKHFESYVRHLLNQ